jgi:hypothetical protein
MYFNEKLYRFFSKLLKKNHSKIGISSDANASAKEKQEEAEDDFNNLSYETGQFRYCKTMIFFYCYFSFISINYKF